MIDLVRIGGKTQQHSTVLLLTKIAYVKRKNGGTRGEAKSTKGKSKTKKGAQNGDPEKRPIAPSPKRSQPFNRKLKQRANLTHLPKKQLVRIEERDKSRL